jgi:hypothetical protein
MKLSVLDQSVITKGQDAKAAFEETVRLAEFTEELGTPGSGWLSIIIRTVSQALHRKC